MNDFVNICIVMLYTNISILCQGKTESVPLEKSKSDRFWFATPRCSYDTTTDHCSFKSHMRSAEEACSQTMILEWLMVGIKSIVILSISLVRGWSFPFVSIIIGRSCLDCQ